MKKVKKTVSTRYRRDGLRKAVDQTRTTRFAPVNLFMYLLKMKLSMKLAKMRCSIALVTFKFAPLSKNFN